MDPSKKRAEEVLRQKHQYAKRLKEETPEQRETRLNRTREYARKRREANPPTREELDEKKRKASEKRQKIKEDSKPVVDMHLKLSDALDMYESSGKRDDRLQFGLTKVEHKQFDNFMDMLDNPKYVGLENVDIPEPVYDYVVRMIHTLDHNGQFRHLYDSTPLQRESGIQWNF